MKKLSALGSVAAGIIAAALLSFLISSDIALFIGFIATVALLIYSDRKKVKIEGIIFIRRTKKGRDFIDRVAQRWHGFWRKISVVGIALGIIFMIGGSVLLLSQAVQVLSGAEGGVKLLLPGPVSAPVNAPGVFVVPWWIWVIGIAVVIIPHEFMHGIMCRIDKVRIKSVGWLLLLVIPGAFVEPDEKQLQKMSRKTKLRVYAAGSFANMIMAAIVLLIFIIVFSSAASPAGVFVSAVEGSPAYNASLNGSIVNINGIDVKNHDDLTRILSQYNPGDTVQVTTAKSEQFVPAFTGGILPGGAAVIGTETKTYDIMLGKHPDRDGAFLGIVAAAPAVTLNMDANTYFILSTLLLWMFLFSFGIGLVNLLPIKPLDGGLIMEELVGGNKQIVRGVSMLMLLVLLFNIVGPMFL